MADGRNTAYSVAKPWLDDGDLQLYHGDSIAVLQGLPSGIAQTCVTSPPYWGLRDYGTGSWSGGDPDCNHQNWPRVATGNKGAVTSTPMVGDCGRCGARRVDDQLGLEATPDEYVAKMVAVFREVGRVLRDDGTLWLNIGDSYAGGNQGGTYNPGTWKPLTGGSGPDGSSGMATWTNRQQRTTLDTAKAAGLKPKDLCGIPWRLALALQADGWYLRSDIIWSKPNPMPESVTDRPTKSHEYVFLFSKRPRYFYDADAVREGYAMSSWTAESDADGSTRRGEQGMRSGDKGMARANGAADGSRYGETSMMQAYSHGGRNLRSVWQVATQPFPEAHFATYPEELVRRCILAGTSERGGCAECGAPWRRIVERAGQPPEPEHRNPAKRLEPGQSGNVGNGNMGFRASRLSGQEMAAWKAANPDVTTGWEPSCTCDSPGVIERFGPQTTPQLVLDPFVGSGTTALVARKHGRRSIGIDLSAEYLELAAQRTQQLSLLGAAR